MKKLTVLAVLLSLLVVAFPGAAAAQRIAPTDSATLYFVHGLPANSAGVDGLPVDLLVNGQFYLAKGVRFGEVVGPFDLPAGDYKLTLIPSEANGDPRAAIAITTLALDAGDNVSVVAHLSEKRAPALSTFINFPSSDVGEKPWAYLVVRNASAVSPMNAEAVEGKAGGDKYAFLGLVTGEQAMKQVSDGAWQATFYQPSSDSKEGSYGKPIAKVQGNLRLGTAYFLYAVGSVEAGSFTVIVQGLPIP